MQWKKGTRYQQQCDIHALSTQRFFYAWHTRKVILESQNYAPVKNFQDQKFENATMAHC